MSYAPVSLPDGDAAPSPRQPQVLYLVFAALSAIGLLASFLLAIDGWRALVQGADAELMCAFDAALDCAPAMQLWQAQILGFPNAYLGIFAFATALAVSMSMLAAAGQGYVTARWLRLGLLIGTALGQLLIFFLMYTTFSSLPALCPWCTVIWIIIWPLLWLQIVDLFAVRAPNLRTFRWPVLVGGYLIAIIVGLLTMGLRVLR